MPPNEGYPDIFADGFTVTVNPVSAILTLTRVQPSGEPGHHKDPTEVVGRVRLPMPVAVAIAKALEQTMAQAARLNTQQAGQQHKN